MADNIKSLLTPFSEVTKFHGHTCPGTAIGYRASEIALNKLSSSKAGDEEFIAIVENDSCSVDAIQAVTGCTMGKGNLILRDYGKQTYTFINRKTGDALRISLDQDLNEINPNFKTARIKALASGADEADKKEFEKQKNILTEKILKMLGEELFKIEKVNLQVPDKASIYGSVKCAECGEQVSEHRARVKNGRIVCIPCFGD